MAQQSHFANVVQSSNNETSDAAAMFRTVMARSTLTCRRRYSSLPTRWSNRAACESALRNMEKTPGAAYRCDN